MLSEPIYFITDNVHKYLEVKPIAEEYGIKLVQYSGFKLEIQSSSLIQIAKTAALHAYLELNKPVLVEDAGLFIEALNWFPGPYTSYVFKTIGIPGILKLMSGVENRRAIFKSAVVIVYEPLIITATGEVEGVIVERSRGCKGFGFDPIFMPLSATKTFAEMDIEEKNKYSHRAIAVRRAFEKLIASIQTLKVPQHDNQVKMVDEL